MSDRELLKAAARAAGYEVEPHPNEKLYPDLVHTLRGKNWNPLTDDGDALRLAVRLGILSRNEILAELIAQEERHHDRATATRRAIVRATAALKEKQTNA